MSTDPANVTHMAGPVQRLLGTLRIARPRALCGYRLPFSFDWVSRPPCPACAAQIGWTVPAERKELTA